MVTKGHQAQMTLIMILFNNNFKISCKQLIFSYNKVILLNALAFENIGFEFVLEKLD